MYKIRKDNFKEKLFKNFNKQDIQMVNKYIKGI